MDEQAITECAVRLCLAMGVKPGAIMLTGGKCGEGYRIELLVMPDDEPDTPGEVSENECEMGKMVDAIFEENGE